MRSLILLALLFLTIPVTSGPTAAERQRIEGLSNPNDCANVLFENSRFMHCIADPDKHRIEMRVTARNGVLYRGFHALASEVDIATVAFGMNGGMYDTRSRPIGYYVEGRERLYPLNRNDGSGNFHMKPNGVFFGSGGIRHVLQSEDFDSNVSARPEFGTQSGPMLLINGVMHSDITPNGTSKYIRNSVGVDADGRAHFVISDEPVSFGRMARMMRDLAETPNALYLDGEVSALWNPAIGRMDGRYPLGPLILVTRIQDEAAP